MTGTWEVPWRVFWVDTAFRLLISAHPPCASVSFSPLCPPCNGSQEGGTRSRRWCAEAVGIHSCKRWEEWSDTKAKPGTHRAEKYFSIIISSSSSNCIMLLLYTFILSKLKPLCVILKWLSLVPTSGCIFSPIFYEIVSFFYKQKYKLILKML